MNKLPFMLLSIAIAGFSHADLRSDITTALQKLNKAVLANDVKAAEAVYKESVTPDFKYVQAGKAQDFKTFLGEFKAGMEMTDKVTSSSTRILSLKQNGAQATGRIELKTIGTIKSADKKIHHIDWTGNFTELYRKVGGQWKISSMTAGPQKFLMDGKPVRM